LKEYLRYTAALVYTVLLVYLLLFKIPENGIFDFLKFRYSDTIFHAFAYSLMFVFWEKTAIIHRLKGAYRIIVLSGSVFFFSMSMEFLQKYTPYRSFEVSDIIANFSGLLTIMILMLRFKKLRKKEQNFK
jgi:VanZ family protein